MSRWFKLIGLLSFFGLMATLIAWILIPERSSQFPTATLLAIALIPLLFPLRGLLHGKPYTYAWNSFLMLFYFTHAVGELYSVQRFDSYAAFAVLLSSLCFISSILYIRYKAKNDEQVSNSTR